MQQNEDWRPILNFPNYEVSRLGRVRSWSRKKGCLIQSRTNNKYLKVTLYSGTQGQTFLVHRLVAQAFLPNPDNLIDVNHKDGNKSNNQVENLEWISHSGNRIHANKTGLYKGHQGSNRRLSRAEVQQVWQWCDQGKKQSEIAKALNVSPGAVSHIISGRTWKHLKP